MAPKSAFDLSPQKRELLARLMKEKGLADTQKTFAIPPRPADTSPPLSFAQERLWYLEKLIPGNVAYNIPLAIQLKGPISPDLLHKSLNIVIQRHEGLRSIFNLEAVESSQTILEEMTIPLPVELWSDDKDLEDVLTAEARQPFNLQTGPPLRARLLKLNPDEHIFLLTIHHIVADGRSLAVFFKELSDCYAALQDGRTPNLPPIPVQYPDFAHWQRQRLSGDLLENQMAYWREQLAGELPTLALPLDHSRPSLPAFNGRWLSQTISSTQTAALKSLAQQEGVTFFVLLLAAFKTLLHRYAGQEEIILGSPVTNRIHHDLDNVIGHFINTLVLRTDLSRSPTFRELLQRQKQVVLDAIANQDIPFEFLLTELQPVRDIRQNPMFQVLFSLQDTPAEANWRTALALPGITAEQLFTHTQTAKMDLSVLVEETPSGTTIAFEYNSDIFETETIQRMMGHFQSILTAVINNPDKPLSTYSLLTTAEKQQFASWNNTHQRFPATSTIHNLFEAQATTTPKATAIIFERESLSYQALNERANQLAHWLIQQGAGPEVPVGIFVNRSIEMLVGMLAILKAGSLYLPLDPAYPAERVQLMLDDTAAPILLTTADLLDRLPQHKAQVFCLDRDWPQASSQPTTNPNSPIDALNLAYLIYTSGSTGRPKGVAISHQAAVAMLCWAADEFSDETLAGTLAVTSICFDLSVYEIFLPLSRGGTIILAENALHLTNLPAKERVTLINTVPSAMTELVKINGIPDNVRVVNLAGEPLPRSLVQAIYARSNAQAVYNLYGPSEDTTYSTFTLVSQDDPAEPTIGRPIANTQAFVTDEQMQPTPLGIIGELFLGGLGVSRGYLNQPALTAARYLPNPFSAEPGGRLYKTGDLAHFQSDGQMVFHGRADHQIKLRGFRIELGEIESVLKKHPDIETALVVARQEPNGQRLVAYLIAMQDGRPTHLALRQYLQSKLPNFMIPAAFVFLKTMPLTPNGKVDRKALPKPETDQPTRTSPHLRPAGQTEEAIAGIWREALQLEQVGRHDNFFDLGGNSLLLVKVHYNLQNSVGRKIPIVQLFTHTTIHDLASYLDQSSSKEPTLATSTVSAGLQRGQRRRARRRRK